ncbi:hypothetical protein O9992_23830 [Vibrio lentus]|nr:hypothetical protein [Vibrio lentus]
MSRVSLVGCTLSGRWYVDGPVVWGLVPPMLSLKPLTRFISSALSRLLCSLMLACNGPFSAAKVFKVNEYIALAVSSAMLAPKPSR